MYKLVALMKVEGMSWRKISTWLNRSGIKTHVGNTWAVTGSSAYSVVKRMHQRIERLEQIKHKSFLVEVSEFTIETWILSRSILEIIILFSQWMESTSWLVEFDNGFYRILKSSLQSFHIGFQYKNSNSLFCSSQSQLSKCRVCRLDNKKGDHLCLKIKTWFKR